MNRPPPVFPALRPLLVAIVAFGTFACTAFADVVTDWNATLEKAMRNPAPSAIAQCRNAAIVHAAIYDAVNGIAKKYTPLHVTGSAPPGARIEAAAAQAAYTALVGILPGRKELFDAQLALSLAQIAGEAGDSQSIGRGRVWGESVAQAILSWRINDGFVQAIPLIYVGSPEVGQWRYGENNGAPGALSLTVTAPFVLTNLDAFDPGPPYGNSNRIDALKTADYAKDLNEVKAHGGKISSKRSQAETDLSLFINVTDPADLNALVRRLISPNAKVIDNARTFALLNVVSIDAYNVCFRAKYKYGLWRPWQAVVHADADQNDDTVADTEWVPNGMTPSHPEYLSGHAVVSSSMLAVAAAIFGDNTPFVHSTSNPGAPAISPAFASFSELADAITEARINIGFHFRTACVLGQAVAEEVANEILSTTALPLQGGQKTN